MPRAVRSELTPGLHKDKRAALLLDKGGNQLVELNPWLEQ